MRRWRLRKGDKQVKYGVEKYGNREYEAADHQPQRGFVFTGDLDRRADDPVSGSTVEHALPDDGRHRDDDSDTAGGATECIDDGVHSTSRRFATERPDHQTDDQGRADQG